MFKPESSLFDSALARVFGFFEGKRNRVLYIEVLKETVQGDLDQQTTTTSRLKSVGSMSAVGELRSTEFSQLQSEAAIEGFKLNLYFSTKDSEVLAGWLGMARTVFVCVVLALSVLKLSTDSETLVLNPLDHMVKKVDRISKNPLEAAEIEEKELHENEELLKKNPKAWLEAKEASSYEPAVLEKIVIKIGMLLAIGFGEAGSRIIAQNIAENSGSVNPMIEGRKMVAIFGFCDIRGFSEVTDALKTDIMPFVNTIADIVHSIVNLHQGAANKNIGEAFLLVWKVPELSGEVSVDSNAPATDPMDNIDQAQAKILADLSVIAFVKVIAAVQKSPALDEFCRKEELLQKMKRERFKISMGFGLHIGWAIEGAIGSKFKIDASYLSPNVNMSARLEAATRQFGVHILVSGVLAEFINPKIRAYMRHIDTVTVKGSIQPVGSLP